MANKGVAFLAFSLFAYSCFCRCTFVLLYLACFMLFAFIIMPVSFRESDTGCHIWIMVAQFWAHNIARDTPTAVDKSKKENKNSYARYEECQWELGSHYAAQHR